MNSGRREDRRGRDRIRIMGFFVTHRECDITFMERKDQAFVTLCIDKIYP